VTFNSKQCTRRDPLYDINPLTGVSFEVFYSDRTLETFGRGGAGWFWWSRERGCPPAGPATGPVLYELFSISPRLGDRFGGYAQHPLR
jgi:hypothetical protein